MIQYNHEKNLDFSNEYLESCFPNDGSEIEFKHCRHHKNNVLKGMSNKKFYCFI